MPLETVRRAVAALADTRLRSSLTVSGIAIGIAALFSLMSIAEGIRTRVVDEWLSSSLMTSLSVMPQGTPSPLARGSGMRRRPGAARPITSAPSRALDDAAAAEIARIAGVRRVWPVISRPVTIEVEPRGDTRPTPSEGGSPPLAKRAALGDAPDDVPAGSHDGPGGGAAPGPGQPGPAEEKTEAGPTTLRGLETDFFWNEDYLRITSGRPLTSPHGGQALLAEDLLKKLGLRSGAEALGRSIVVRWRELAPEAAPGAEAVPGLPFFLARRSARFTVTGVFEKRGTLSLRAAGIIVLASEARKIATLDPEKLRALFEGGAAASGYPALDVYLTVGADLEGIESRIKEMGFETLSGAEIAGRIRRSILVLQAVLGGLGTIAIAVATLGIANTLLTAVYERTREIGVMKAVGARRRDIRRQFFAEAGLIGLAGGLIGLVTGFGADRLLSVAIGQIVRRQGGDDPGAIAVHTPMIALGCLAFSVLLSLIAGTLPAVRAARLDPARTLRHE